MADHEKLREAYDCPEYKVHEAKCSLDDIDMSRLDRRARLAFGEAKRALLILEDRIDEMEDD